MIPPGWCGEEVSSEFVIPGCDAAPVLDAAEVIFDLVALPVETLRTIGFSGGVAASGDDRQGALVLDLFTHFLTVVSLIGRDSERRSGRIEHVLGGLTVVDLSAGHREVQRVAFAVNGGVDFRGAPATADADRLILLPPFAPLAARWAFTIVLSIR